MIANDNVIARFQHGRFGNAIFRVVGNNSICSQVPDYSKIRWSKAQKANRARFRDAMKYARKAFENPEVQDHYQRKTRPGLTKWNVAVADYMVKPEILKIDTSRYKGHAGDTISIDAYDKYKVAAVIVMIINALGFETESGMAVLMPSGDWVYQANVSNPDWKGGRVVVRVVDIPGNETKSFRATEGT